MNSHRLVLFDLDHTLYDAQGSWRRPLAALVKSSWGKKSFPWVQYFEIRRNSEVFEIFFDESFRHHWLTTELASLMVMVREKKIPVEPFLSDLRSIAFKLNLVKRMYPRPGAFVLAARSLAQGFPAFRSAIDGIRQLSGSPQISELVSAYDHSLGFRPYPGVIEALDLLKDRGIPFYMASEGDYEQQCFKIRLLGLEEYFSGKILASEIYKLNHHYMESRKIITGALAGGSYANGMNSARLQQADDDVRRFELLTHKEEYYYYLSALKAIASNAENPELFLKEARIDDMLTTEINPAQSVIMVGDRDDKDMSPVWQLLKDKALLIRLRAGKYRKEPRSPAIPGSHYVECRDFGEVLDQLKKRLNDHLSKRNRHGARKTVTAFRAGGLKLQMSA